MSVRIKHNNDDGTPNDLPVSGNIVAEAKIKEMVKKKYTISSTPPTASDGENGDIWFLVK